MNATQAIDQVLAYTDQINAGDADYNDRRIRLRYLLHELVSEICTYAEWTFLRRVVTKTIGAGLGYANLDADFGQLGDYGGVYLAAQQDGNPLKHVPEHAIQQMRSANDRSNTPACFSIYGEDPSTFAKRINFQINDADFDVLIDYLIATPAVDEAANLNTIKVIPEDWHQRVIIPGLRAKSLEQKGDSRWQNHHAMYLSGLVAMKGKHRRRQGSIWQLNSFFGG